MNDEIKMLRDALVKCEAACNLPSRHPIIQEVRFALQVSSGNLPEGYEIIPDERYPSKRYVAYHGECLKTDKGRDRFFYDEFKARFYCWQHSRQVKQVATNML
jgi:hypothetical protein